MYDDTKQINLTTRLSHSTFNHQRDSSKGETKAINQSFKDIPKHELDFKKKKRTTPSFYHFDFDTSLINSNKERVRKPVFLPQAMQRQ